MERQLRLEGEYSIVRNAKPRGKSKEKLAVIDDDLNSDRGVKERETGDLTDG